MLTRYRETYNLLTNSKAFTETGALDNSKVNKNIFTPNNLKAVCLGSQGVLAVYYTTNNTNTKLVNYLPFSRYPRVEAEIEKALKTDKGMADALFDGLKFSNLEEIYLFTEGFTHPSELQQELGRLQKFISNRLLIDKSFKRLRGVCVINGFLTQEFLNLSNSKSLFKQFKDVNAPVEVLLQLKPDKDELGLIKHVELDNGQYKLDAAFDKDLDSKMRNSLDCRLSKYFIDERERVKRKLEELEKQAEQDKTKQEENVEDYDEQLINAVEATINRLEAFYYPLWNGKYFGILHEDGLSFTEQGLKTKKIKSKTDAIYSAWREVVVNGGAVEDIEKTSFNTGVSYSPGFHHNVLKSKESWSKGVNGRPSIKKSLEKTLLKKFSEVFESNPDKINDLSTNLTNCIVITKWGKNDFFVRFTGVKPEQKDTFIKVFERYMVDTYLAGSQPGMVSSCEIDRNGVGTLTYIVNWQKFLDEILFAYKLYSEHGVKPSLTKAVIGLKMDGKPLTVDLIETGQMLTTILAGSRSGKGVMTMGLLASLFGAGGSVVYLDNKPDIGAMLWDLEREYANKGLKLLSLDIGKEEEEFTGSTPIRTGPLNLLSEDEIAASTEFRTLRLCKLFQFVTLIGGYSSKISEMLGVKTDNLFFIVDELTSLNQDFVKLESYVINQSKKYRDNAAKAKATNEDKKLAKYYGTLETMIMQINRDLVKGLTKEWGQSGVRVILIGQELGANWKVAGKGFDKSLAGILMSATHKTIAGRGQANEDTFRLTKSQNSLASQRGVFTLTKSAPTPVNSTGAKALGMNLQQANTFNQFRSFFSLVKNDFNYEEFESEGAENYVVNHPKRFTSQLLSGYLSRGESELKNVIGELYDFDSGCNKDEVSFSGLLKVMQKQSGISEEQLIKNMNKGYSIMDGLFRALGLNQKYESVEEYLCDCSPNGVFTLNELKGMLGLDGMTYTPVDDQEVKDSEDLDFGVGNYVDYKSDEAGLNEKVKNNESQFKQPRQQTFNTQDRPVKASSYQDINNPKPQRPSRPQRQQQSYQNIYSEPLVIKKNPFKTYQNGGAISTINALKDITDIIMQDIEKIIGDYSLINNFTITSEGKLIFSGTLYTPEFEQSFIDTLPAVLQEKIVNGALVEFFNLRTIYKFKNLQILIIENQNLAQGRARKELGIGFRKRFSVLFKKFKNLNYINVGGIEYTRENPDISGEDSYLLHNTGLFKSKTPKQQVNKGDGWMDKVWDSKPVKVLTNAFGWTLGVQSVYLAATLFGPVGLLFGALATAGAYKELKNSSNVVSKPTTTQKTNNDYQSKKRSSSNKNQRNSNRNRTKGSSWFNEE